MAERCPSHCSVVIGINKKKNTNKKTKKQTFKGNSQVQTWICVKSS